MSDELMSLEERIRELLRLARANERARCIDVCKRRSELYSVGARELACAADIDALDDTE